MAWPPPLQGGIALPGWYLEGAKESPAEKSLVRIRAAPSNFQEKAAPPPQTDTRLAGRVKVFLRISASIVEAPHFFGLLTFLDTCAERVGHLCLEASSVLSFPPVRLEPKMAAAMNPNMWVW